MVVKLNGDWLSEHTESVVVTGGEYTGNLKDVFQSGKMYETSLSEDEAKQLEKYNNEETFPIGFMFVKTDWFEKTDGWVKVYLW